MFFSPRNAAKVLNEAIAKFPKNLDIRATLASTYGDKCDLKNAQKVVDEIVSLDQSYTLQARDFMSQLEKKCQK